MWEGDQEEQKQILKMQNEAYAAEALKTARRIEFIADKYKRSATGTKRSQGLMKKASELATLTGYDVLAIVVTDHGNVRYYCTDYFDEDAATIVGRLERNRRHGARPLPPRRSTGNPCIPSLAPAAMSASGSAVERLTERELSLLRRGRRSESMLASRPTIALVEQQQPNGACAPLSAPANDLTDRSPR
jgi:hypothetical protein